MRVERELLKFFSESDLRPSAQGQPNAQEAPDDNPAARLLTPRELEDISQLADSVEHHGEMTITRSHLTRKPHLRMFVTFLIVLGAVSVAESGSSVRINVNGRLARHLPRILSLYIAEGFSLIEDWNRRLLIDPDEQLSALGLLRKLEVRRIDLTRRAGRTAQPLAERPGAFAVFHARDNKGRDCYLFETNKDWRRLNFIGGKQEPDENGSFTETVIREIWEELGIPRDRLTLTPLNHDPIVGYALAGNGCLGRYPAVLFGVQVDGPVPTQVQHRWLTEPTVRACLGIPDSPIMVNPHYMDFLIKDSPSMLSRTPLTTQERVRSADLREVAARGEASLARWARVLGENKDLLAAVLTITAALITLAVAF